MGGPPLMGPPPAELAAKFKKLKASLYCMMFCCCIRLVCGMYFQMTQGHGLLDTLGSLLSLILNTTIGIFLFRDDERIGQIYGFLVRTCCQMCADQCGGGMSCLFNFVLTNAITLLVDLILSGLVGKLVDGFSAITQAGDPIQIFVIFLYTLALLAGLVAQIVSVVVGWQAYKAAQNIGSGVTQTGGDWGGGGSGSGGTQMRAGDRSDAPSAPQRQNNNFHLFSGGGQTLGSA